MSTDCWCALYWGAKDKLFRGGKVVVLFEMQFSLDDLALHEGIRDAELTSPQAIRWSRNFREALMEGAIPWSNVVNVRDFTSKLRDVRVRHVASLATFLRYIKDKEQCGWESWELPPDSVAAVEAARVGYRWKGFVRCSVRDEEGVQCTRRERDSTGLCIRHGSGPRCRARDEEGVQCTHGARGSGSADPADQ
jgi:hypothetical protein